VQWIASVPTQWSGRTAALHPLERPVPSWVAKDKSKLLGSGAGV